MNDRDDFLCRLAEDEDDESARLVYADWLEERGEDDEADRQRSWTAAKAWLVHLCEEGKYERDDDYGNHIDYAELVRLGRQAIQDGSYAIHFGSAERLMDEVREHRSAFWENLSIVTGLPVPDDDEDRGYFSCAC